MTVYPWLVFLHVLGAFVFAFGHGTSAVVSFKLRGERDRARIAALLEVSQLSQAVMYAGWIGLLISGIAAGVVGQWFGQLWIWAAIAVLIITSFLMYAVATAYYARLRAAVGQPGAGKKGAPPQPASDAELVAMLQTRRPEALVAIGGLGLAVILWLMVFKP